MFNTIIRSKFFYDLEYMQLANVEFSILNAFQNKSFRRSLHISPIFIDRE